MIHCLVVDDEPLAREAIINYINRMPDLQLAGEFENAIEALNILRRQTIELIFLDIEMPEIDGIKFLKSLKNKPGVIFTTAYRNYAVDAFDLDVIDFLLKPISFERFLNAIDKFYHIKPALSPMQETNHRSKDQVLNVKADRKIFKINIDSILYFESLKDYVKIVCQNETLVTHETLGHYEKLLEENGFLRIHRSYLVATNKIISFDAETIYLDKKELPLSRTYKQQVLQILNP